MRRAKCYDIQDIVKRIPKKQRIVDEKTFGHVVKAYFQNVVDTLLQYDNFMMPHSMGMFRKIVVDMSPYYDIKTGKVVGGVKQSKYWTNRSNRIIKISYYKCDLKHNPFRFFRFLKGDYFTHQLARQYEQGKLDSLYVNKI
jgi:hypothetical protein